jgi:glycosyltransferase involved in cell wall biosynthesis
MLSFQKLSENLMMIQKVMFVISNISFGGAQRVTWTLAKWMNNNNIEPVVVAIGHSTNNYTLPEGIKVIQIGQKHNCEIMITISRIRNIINREKPAVVITLGISTSIYSVLAMIGLRIPHIVSERNDPIHFAGKVWVKKISRALMKLANGFVFQTEEARDFYPEDVKKHGCVIPNPLMATNLPQAQVALNEKLVVTMGRLTGQKNHRMLVDAFSKFVKTHPDYQLHIYGSGELRAQTAAYIIEKGMESYVTLFEACDDVLQRICGAEMFVLTSDFEGMPNALMEAMAMGLPSISTDCPCGGPRYLIQHRENGMLVPVGDAVAMEKAMCTLADDPGLRCEIGQKAQKIQSLLSVDQIGQRWLDFCEEIVRGK